MLEEYWALNELHELAFVYNEIKVVFSEVVSLFEKTQNAERETYH